MKKPRRIIYAAAAAAVIVLMGLTVYASTRLNLFSFLQDDRFVTMRTTSDITESEARDLVMPSESNPNAEDAPTVIDNVPTTEYDSVEQAQTEMDMKIILPAAMPDMELTSATGQRYDYGGGGNQRTVWLTYADETGRLFAVTTSRVILSAESGATHYTTHDIDAGSLASYKSKTGVDFTLLTESDETGERTAHIAMVMIGEYEYALGFFGFTEGERQDVIDSVDLSAYQE